MSSCPLEATVGLQEAREILTVGLLYLKPRERGVLLSVYEDDLQMQEAAIVNGVCDRQVTRLHQRGLDKLRAFLNSVGINRPEDVLYSA